MFSNSGVSGNETSFMFTLMKKDFTFSSSTYSVSSSRQGRQQLL